MAREPECSKRLCLAGLAACAMRFCRLPGIKLPGIHNENKVAVMTPTPITEEIPWANSLPLPDTCLLRGAPSGCASRLDVCPPPLVSGVLVSLYTASPKSMLASRRTRSGSGSGSWLSNEKRDCRGFGSSSNWCISLDILVHPVLFAQNMRKLNYFV